MDIVKRKVYVPLKLVAIPYMLTIKIILSKSHLPQKTKQESDYLHKQQALRKK